MMMMAKQIALAALAGVLGTAMSGAASAQTQRDKRSQAGGTEVHGEPSVDRRAQPERSDEPGCTGASAINYNPPQAAGDNAAYPNGHAAPQGDGPFYQCYADDEPS
jgi:hypothetical protein